MTTQSARLRVERLSVYAGAQALLEDVSFEVPPGQLAVVLGPSGAGKTTLLRALAGAIPIRGGRIWLGDDAIETWPVQRRRIGWVQQDPLLFPHLSVADNIAFGLRVRGAGRAAQQEAAAFWLERLELQGLGARRPEQLSGGQQSRVAIARALAMRPRLLLLDEPFAHLDPELRRRLSRQLRALQRQEALTGILVTHARQEAAELGDVVIILQDGRIRQQGPTAAVFAAPQSLAVAEFLGWQRWAHPRRPDAWLAFQPAAAQVRVRFRNDTTEGARDITLAPDDRAGLWLTGLTVEECWFQGGDWQLVAGDGTQRCQLPWRQADGAPVPSPGATVDVRLPAEAVRWYERATGLPAAQPF